MIPPNPTLRNAGNNELGRQEVIAACRALAMSPERLKGYTKLQPSRPTGIGDRMQGFDQHSKTPRVPEFLRSMLRNERAL